MDTETSAQKEDAVIFGESSIHTISPKPEDKRHQAIDLKLFFNNTKRLREVQERYIGPGKSLKFLNFKCWLALTEPQNFKFTWDFTEGFILNNGILVDDTPFTNAHLSYSREGAKFLRLLLARKDDRRICTALNVLEPSIKVIFYFKISEDIYDCGLVVLRRCDFSSRQAALSLQLYEEVYKSVQEECKEIPDDKRCDNGDIPANCLEYCRANYAKHLTERTIPEQEVELKEYSWNSLSGIKGYFKEKSLELQDHHRKRLEALAKHKGHLDQFSFSLPQKLSSFEEDLSKEVRSSFEVFLRRINRGDRIGHLLHCASQGDYAREKLRYTMALLWIDSYWSKKDFRGDIGQRLERRHVIKKFIEENIDTWTGSQQEWNKIFEDIHDKCNQDNEEEPQQNRAENKPSKLSSESKVAKKAAQKVKRKERTTKKKQERRDLKENYESKIQSAKLNLAAADKLKNIGPVKFAEIILDAFKDTDLFRVTTTRKLDGLYTKIKVVFTSKLNSFDSRRMTSPLLKDAREIVNEFERENSFSISSLQELALAMHEEAWLDQQRDPRVTKYPNNHPGIKNLVEALERGKEGFRTNNLANKEDILRKSAATQITALLLAWQSKFDRPAYDRERLGIAEILRRYETDVGVKEEIELLAKKLEGQRGTENITEAVFDWAIKIDQTDFEKPLSREEILSKLRSRKEILSLIQEVISKRKAKASREKAFYIINRQQRR